jgi:hypothetical protein
MHAAVRTLRLRGAGTENPLHSARCRWQLLDTLDALEQTVKIVKTDRQTACMHACIEH